MRTLLLAMLPLFLALTGCFNDAASTDVASTGSTKPSLIASSDFAGATSASNTITGLQIFWGASKVTPSSYRVYRVNGTKKTLLTTLAPNVTSYIDGSVTWGSLYSYIVRAVDSNDVEDANENKVTALSWAGISSVEAASRSSVTVNFASTTAVADEVRIYIQPAAGGDRTLAATITGSDSSATLTGLRTGFSYSVSAQAYVSSLKKEDGNTATFSVTTKTTGYDDDSGSNAAWLNATNVRAFGASPGAPVHPSHPERTPTTDLVEISFRSFNGLDASTTYVVTRAAEGQSLDTSVDTLCDTTTLTSCRVKCSSSSTSLSGTGILNCRDQKAGPAPNRYRYTMSIQRNDGDFTWTEPVPADRLENYSLLVPMPPANMNLLQRDAVNYEICNQMNAAIDPNNHNRCPYTGVGAVPFNSGPGKPALSFESGYYDFGYNLFVDRFEMGCKWTSASNGGMCGAGGTPGDCIDYASTNTMPSNSIGQDGNVFQMLWSSENTCFYKYKGTWYRSTSVASLPDSASIFAAMYTSNPSDNAGKIATMREYSSQFQAYQMCQAQVDTNYGAKRIPRKREYTAYAAFPTMPNDIYGVTYSQAYTLAMNGGNFNSSGYRCPVNQSIGNISYPSNITDLLSSNFDIMAIYTGSSYYGQTFPIGAVSNVDCQGRYGIHNVQDNWLGTWISDSFYLNSATMTLTGMSSSLDSGNIDLLQDLTGGWTGFSINYSTANVNGTSNYYFPEASGGSSGMTYYAVPLGLPLTTSSSSVYLPRASFTEHYYANFYFPYTSTPTYGQRSVRMSKRWQTDTTTSGLNANTVSTVRCVMSAE